MSNANSILKAHNLKSTESRLTILAIFKKNMHALSYNDIESLLTVKLDRVTVYRTLKSFEENGLIHQIYDGSAQVKYALCHNGSCNSNQHKDSHAHFRCDKCDKTFCLSDVITPMADLPEGYQSKSQSVFIQGICKVCNHYKN
ncbi:transcriptional repressor [Flavobacteriales bacterium]|nr:transcriptional repressor [Flavobacteriales bacterium]